MQNLNEKFRKTDAQISYSCRAKYYYNTDGIPTLACVQKFSDAKFRESGWEALDKEPKTVEKSVEKDNETSSFANVQRATRRAKILAFDYIMNNPDLDLFATFTYSPEAVEEKDSYEECYRALGVWLSNRVQRCGLKYVIVPERTKAGDIHFHAIMNSSAVKLVNALSPYTSRQLTHNGKPLYNIIDWKFGFTSAEFIATADGDRRAVSKYIFKYMGKQMGQKIGGRYVLTGGELRKPLYVYSDDEREFFEQGEEKYSRDMYLEECGLSYKEWSFI